MAAKCEYWTERDYFKWQLAGCSQFVNDVSLQPAAFIVTSVACEQHIYHCCVYSEDSWWWTEELSETGRVFSKNKFERLVHLVGFIIRIYNGARSSERQIIGQSFTVKMKMRCFHPFSDITVLLRQAFHCSLFSQQNPYFHSEQFREMVHGDSNDLIRFQQYKVDSYAAITKVCIDITYSYICITDRHAHKIHALTPSWFSRALRVAQSCSRRLKFKSSNRREWSSHVSINLRRTTQIDVRSVSQSTST